MKIEQQVVNLELAKELDMNPNDYDEDGNNIVPCPICLDVYCPSKKGGKCHEEDAFVKAHTDPYEAQDKISVEKKYNKDGYLVEVKVNGHVISIPEQHQPSVAILDENLKNTEWIKEKIYLTPEQAKVMFPDIDPYLAQGSPLRVHHPVQPKTQVERWWEEFWNNENAIETCCRKPDENNYYDCSRNGTDNCNERAKKNKDILGYITDATQPIHPRYPTGTFADDKCNCAEITCKVGCKKNHTHKTFSCEKCNPKVTLLDKIKKLLQ